MNFGSKLFPLECTQAKKLTDGRLVRHGRPHVRRTDDGHRGIPKAHPEQAQVS